MANDEWQTPNNIILDVRELFGGVIDLDAASNEHSNRRIQAQRYFSKTFGNSALNHFWCAENVFLNPPYSRIITSFIVTLLREYNNRQFNEAVVLVNSDTGTAWYHKLCMYSPSWVITAGRIAFLDKSDQPVKANRMAQTIFYLGERQSEFEEVFSKHGLVIGRLK